MRTRKAGFLLGGLFLLAGWASAVTAGQSTQDKNKATARLVFEEVLAKGNFAMADSLYTKDFVAHAGKRTATHEEDIQWARGWREAFPDLTVRVEQMIAEGDLVAVRWNARGTNTGTGNGLPATGKSIEVGGMVFYRFVNGKIAEEWTVADELGLYRQLGLVASPAPTAR